MSARIKILVPEATTNYIQNPSFRFDTTDWNAVGSNIARTQNYALYGIASLQVITAGLALREGVYYRVSSLAGINSPITVSAFARGKGTVHIRLYEGLGKEWVSDPVSLYADQWTRLEVSGYTTGKNDLRLYVETDGDARAITFYIDGCQMELKPYATTFCDGSQPGCRWNILESASNSSRDAYTRLGGRWLELAGPCRENDDIYVTLINGLGMASVQNNIQSWSQTPGSFYQNFKIGDRSLSLAFTTKNKKLGIVKDTSLEKLHELRQQLIDLFKPDLNDRDEPFLLSYQDGKRELFLPVYYDGGLEGTWDIRNPWVNTFPISFLAVDPLLYENNYHSQELTFREDKLLNNVVAREDGKWNHMNYGASGAVSDLEIGKLGQIFAGGALTIANNSALAVDPLLVVNYITYWDGTKWNRLGTGANNNIFSVAVAPNGDVYVTGLFTTIGGIAANRIAKWNGSAWSALGTGLDSDGYIVKVAPNGDVYAGGDFSNAGGIVAHKVARWDGSSWHPLGAFLGVDNDVYSIVISKDGSNVYLSGQFANEHGVGTNLLLRVARYDPVTDLIYAMGSGFSDNATELVLSPSGVLYACGDFLYSGTTLVNKIARWNGTAWIPLDAGVSGGNISSFDVSADEQLIVVGTFTSASGIPANRVALWNGSNWVHLDILLGGGIINPGPSSVIFSRNDIYIAGDGFNTGGAKSILSALNYVTNLGTAEVPPVIYIYGPGYLRWIENQTTGKRVYMNLTILDDEEVFIDFGAGKIWGAARGDLVHSILPGSDFSDFTLVPGENKMAVLMTNDVGSKMYMYYRPRHWSADATIDAEPLS